MNTPEDTQRTTADAVNKLSPEQQAQIDETARQLATSTAVPGVTTEMLDKGREALNSSLDTVGPLLDVTGVVVTVVDVLGSAISAVADLAGDIDLGGFE